MNTITMKLPAGPIMGAVLENEYEFRGVRYARAERWHAPEVVDSWEGTYDAVSSFGKKCWQYDWKPDEFYGKEYYTDPSYEVEKSEDCLFMTITVPKEEVFPKPEGGYPVAIWYHGGGMVNGWGTEMEFDGEAFAKRGIILCRVNERLNIFGGFCHPAILERDGTGGNYQLRDHFAALDFVRANVKGFGGNPDKISIFGQSAGSMGVEAMVCSPKIEGKIAGAVMQSGIYCGSLVRMTGTLETSAACGKAFLEKKGMTFEEFEKLDAAALYALAGEYGIFSKEYGVSYAPIIDGDMLMKPYQDSIDSGELPAINYMAGCCSKDIFGDPDHPEDSLMYKAAKIWCTSLNRMPGARAYAYLFARSMPGDDAGAFHSADLWYVFGTYPRCWRPLDERDAKLSERMNAAWAAFFTDGVPEKDWRPCTDEDPFFYHWDIENN